MANITVTFSDGTPHTYDNVPDTITPDQIEARAANDFAGRKVVNIDRKVAGTSYSDQFLRVLANPISATSRAVGGVGEAALSIGTGLATSIAGGLHGLSVLPTRGTEGAAETIRGYQESAYHPQTPAGEAALRVAGLPIEIPSRILGYGGRKLDEAISGEGGGAGGFETVGETAPAIAATLFGGMSALKSAKGVTVKDVANKLIPDRVPVIGKINDAIADVLHARKSNNAGHILLAEKYLQNLAKDASPAEIQMIIAGLERRGKSPIAGSPSTSADALARANRELELKGKPERFGVNYVALEEGLSRVPETSKVLTDFKLKQEQARAGVIERGAGTEKQMADAVADRTKATEPLYAKLAASKEVVNIVPAMNLVTAYLKNNPANKDMVTALDQVKASFIIKNGKVQSLRSNPQHLQSAIDNINLMLGKAENKPKIISKQLMSIKEALELQINKVEPSQGLATKTFADKSIPINQMQLWRKIEEKFSTSTGKESPGTFLKTLQNEKKLIKDATGFKRGSRISDIFDTKQSSLAAKLASEMEAGLTKQRMAGEVNLPGIGKPAQGIEPKLPNMLMRETMIANFLLKNLSTDANVPVNIAAARILANPQLLANVLKQIKPEHRTQIFKTFKDVAANKATAIGGMVSAEQQTP